MFLPNQADVLEELKSHKGPKTEQAEETDQE